jgi:hypothetical protein
MNRKIVRDLLKRTKYTLVEAHDGEAGVAKALEIRPDLILMDIQSAEDFGARRNAQAARGSRDGADADHRDHVVRAERRRPESEGSGRDRLSRETVQPVRPAEPDPQAAAGSLIQERSTSSVGKPRTSISKSRPSIGGLQ